MIGPYKSEYKQKPDDFWYQNIFPHLQILRSNQPSRQNKIVAFYVFANHKCIQS